jgi:hypothetical protein
MVGLQTLNLAIGVRVPASQPINLLRTALVSPAARFTFQYFTPVGSGAAKSPNADQTVRTSLILRVKASGVNGFSKNEARPSSTP